MIADKYKQSLIGSEGKKGAFLYWATLFVPFFLVVMGVLNLWAASRIGSVGNFTLGDFIRTWLEEIDVQREYTYSGIFLAGLHRFNTALLQFCFAIVLFPLVWAVTFLRKRDRAVLDALREHGEV